MKEFTPEVAALIQEFSPEGVAEDEYTLEEIMKNLDLNESRARKLIQKMKKEGKAEGRWVSIDYQRKKVYRFLK